MKKELGKTCANYTFQPYFWPLKTKKIFLYISIFKLRLNLLLFSIWDQYKHSLIFVHLPLWYIDYPVRLNPSVILRSTHWTPQHCAVAVVAWARFDTTSTAGFTCFLFFHPLWLSFYFILPPSLFPFFFYVLTVGVFDWFCPNIQVFFN